MNRKRLKFPRFTMAYAIVVVVMLAVGISAVQAEVGDQLLKITASDAAVEDYFGWAVAIENDYAIVGSEYKYNTTGSAYVFDVNTGNELFTFMASNAGVGDRFGCSVGISETTAIIGASGTNIGAGSAYLFDLESGNELRQLTALDGAATDQFGCSAAISGNIAVVGSYRSTQGDAVNAGSVYVFDVSTGNQLFKLTANDGASGDMFGYSVSISGNIAIVGSPRNNAAGTYSGSAYLFDVNTGNQLAKITSNDISSDNFFGSSVAISGNTAIVGASNNSAYLFSTSGGQIAKLTASDGVWGDGFGRSVSICGNTAIVGSPGNDDAGTSSGSAYLFNTANGNQIAKLTASDADEMDNFGSGVAIGNGRAIVGAMYDESAAEWGGSAYIFETPESVDIPPVDVTDYKQTDEEWAGDQYDHSNKTIGKKGCALTCLSMALDYAGITDQDPGTLNYLMQTEGGFSGSSVDWAEATRITANDAGKPEIRFHAMRSSDTNDLDSLLATGNPVIVRVTNNGNDHFVVVTGKEDGQYTISDPGYSSRTSLSDYGNNFETRGYVDDPLDVSELDISVSSDLMAEGAGSGIYIYVEDAMGSVTYYDSFGEICEWIPNSTLFVDSIGDIDSDDPAESISQMVHIFQPMLGDYYVMVMCPDGSNTPYELTMTAFAADGSLMWRDIHTGSLAEGEWEDFTVSYTPEPTTLSLLCIMAAAMIRTRRKRQAA